MFQVLWFICAVEPKKNFPNCTTIVPLKLHHRLLKKYQWTVSCSLSNNLFRVKRERLWPLLKNYFHCIICLSHLKIKLNKRTKKTKNKMKILINSEERRRMRNVLLFLLDLSLTDEGRLMNEAGLPGGVGGPSN